MKRVTMHGATGSRFKEPLLDSTTLKLFPSITESPVLNRAQRRHLRTRSRVRNAGLAPAPLDDFFNLIQRRMSSVEPFGRGSLRRSVAGELGDSGYGCRRETSARPRSRFAFRWSVALVGVFDLALVG